MEKCPICGGMIGNRTCLSCGFEIPEEDALAAPYNYDPDDYMLQDLPAQSGNYEKSDHPDRGEMDALMPPSSESVGEAFAEKSSVKKTAVKFKPQENFSPPPTNYTHITPPIEEPYEEPQSAFEVFVSGFVYEVKRHWWKALLIALIPISAIVFGMYYLWVGGGRRRYRYEPVNPENLNLKSFGLGILYMVIGFGLMFEGWDPIGINELILSIMRASRGR